MIKEKTRQNKVKGLKGITRVNRSPRKTKEVEDKMGWERVNAVKQTSTKEGKAKNTRKRAEFRLARSNQDVQRWETLTRLKGRIRAQEKATC